jgi:hypothetical protein
MIGVPDSVDRRIAIAVVRRERLELVLQLRQKMGRFSKIEDGHTGGLL